MKNQTYENSTESAREVPVWKKKGPTTDNEEQKLQLGAERAKKYRVMKQLKKCIRDLSECTIEQVEAICIVKNLNKNNYKYFGFGSLVHKFENGEALSKGPPKKSKISVVFQQRVTNVEELTLENCSFDSGSEGGEISHIQREELENPQLNLFNDKHPVR